MPNDLVQWRPSAGGDGHHQETPDRGGDGGGEPWDLPPVDGASPGESNGRAAGPPLRLGGAADAAERDAAKARRQGDHSFATQRESDAREQRQSRWDWGDFRTWLWIAAMSFGFLLVVAFIYFMPQGRHAAPPPIRVY